ncbi:MAG TPA: DinB family protein [Puia sp.]|nr:DinB family protein [Puia sp.]
MDQQTVLVKAALNAWQIQADRTTKFINESSDELLLKEIAPGKNRGIYLMGHLAAIHDAIPEILGFGKKAHPELAAIFISAPDKTVDKIPTVSELRAIWASVHDRLKNAFSKMPADKWFTRHESMTDADFEKDPARNKMSVLINRTNHFAYHFGQLRLLK